MYDTHTLVRSVYIHWPFCPYKCHFCPFVAFAGKDSFMERYHAALVHEITAFAQNASTPHTLDTLYFGGGTPSTYPNELLLDMFAILRRVFVVARHAEITVEVNPGTVDQQKLQTWHKIGINRLSIGVQSLKDGVLSDLNRHQSRADVIRLMEQVGTWFNNVSVDIILGLPGITEDDWRELLHTLVRWPITHVSMYMLEVHEGTALAVRVAKKTTLLPDDERLADLYTWSMDFLQQAGFEQYEVSSFTRAGYASRHNTVYWDRKPYKGFGVGACSFDGMRRFQNGSDLHAYITAHEENRDNAYTSELLTRQQIINEKIMLGVRRQSGIALADLYLQMTNQEREAMNQVIAALERDGIIIQHDGHVRLTPRGLLVENSIATALSIA